MKLHWRIIVGKDTNGNIEYQVSDGDVGERSTSHDFKIFINAKKCMEKLNETTKIYTS